MSNSSIFRSVNPWTGEGIFQSRTLPLSKCVSRLECQYDYWRTTWARMTIDERIKIMEGIPHRLEAGIEEWASVITREVGKPIDQSKAEILKCIQLCRWYLENGTSILQESPVINSLKSSSVRHDPLGVVLGIMPWNFPFWQVFRFAFPNLLAGNVVALKPAPSVGMSGQALQTLFSDFPGFQTYFCNHDDIASLIRHESICGIAFTGSDATGRRVAADAGTALKPCVLELGGSDPAIVSDACDVNKAAESLLRSRTFNNGQTCIAAKRWIIHRSVMSEFLNQVRTAANNLNLGSPSESGVWLSCMANEAAFTRIQDQIHRARQCDVNFECLVPDSQKHALRILPSLLHMSNDSFPWYYEEFFGPVAFVQEYDTLEEAVRLANDSGYGLSATVWTDDDAEFNYYCQFVDAGSIARNQVMASDPSIPFGGIKNSGYGKELGLEGLFPFLNNKYIHH